MKTTFIPALITLSAGAVDCLLAIRNHLGLREMLTELLIVLIIFYVVGVIVKMVFDRNFPPMEDSEENETEGEGAEEAEGGTGTEGASFSEDAAQQETDAAS